MSGTELSGEAELEQLQERSFSYFLHETEVRTLADALYRRVDWVWALNNGKTLTHGWRPEDGFIPYRWESRYGYDYVYAGPLFIHQLSHCWIDFRGIQDAYMRERGVPYGPDDGTVSPWAMAASLPFAPDLVLPAIDHCINYLKLTLNNPYGFKATYNPTFPEEECAAAEGDKPFGWVSPSHFGINQGPIVLMIENYRTGLLWDLMRRCEYVTQGLKRAGFRGGWL